MIIVSHMEIYGDKKYFHTMLYYIKMNAMTN